ncbi:MAG: hypothetical protein OEO77_10820, partial [Acidimicrobiia bacterium]|nr:hypothetical protein [Acidimicrobiia bacterium]
VRAEWVDRYGPLPPAAESLFELAILRVEAIRVGLADIVKLRSEVRLGPVDFTDSQEVRLARLSRNAVLRADEGILFIPAPADATIATDLIGFLRAMWPADE